MMFNKRQTALMSLVMAATITVKAEVKLPPVLSSHMVLQRDRLVPIWGDAAPNEKVSVKFRGQHKQTTADANGHWQVKLDPLQAGGPDTMTVNTVVLDDVLVGEVWVGSGQSNMAGNSGGYAKGDPVLAGFIAAAPYPTIRFSRCTQPWQVADSKNVAGFSALLFSFGVRLQQELGVPVGLLQGAVGGTPSGYWLSKAAYADDPACQALVAQAKAALSKEQEEQAQKAYAQQLVKWEAAVVAAKAQGEKKLPRKPAPVLKPGECNNEVGHLYERYIRPFQPFGIRGVLWDQGESGTAIQGVDQYTLMGALITGWRKEWSLLPALNGPAGAVDEFPFIYIQKPSGCGCAWDEKNPVTDQAQKFEPLPNKVPSDGQYVETHVRIMRYPNTAMAISSDLGPNTHPTNKSGYGHRAADVALGMVYGKPIEYYGPLYHSHNIEGDKVRVKYTHIGQGLAFKHGDKLQGFALAGEDKAFRWADAVIDGETVVLSCPNITKPLYVRYAWSQKRAWANLFNKDGLPAIPFRTDTSE